METWRCLEVVLLIVALGLREKSCKSEFLVVSGDQLGYSYKLSAVEFSDKCIKKLRASLNMLLIWVEEVASAYVVVRFDEVFGFEADERHTRRLEVFDFVHVLLGYLDFLAA